MGRGSRKDDTGLGCLVYVIMAVLLMPLVGLYMLIAGDKEQKGIGIALTIVGIIIWAMSGML